MSLAEKASHNAGWAIQVDDEQCCFVNLSFTTQNLNFLDIGRLSEKGQAMEFHVVFNEIAQWNWTKSSGTAQPDSSPVTL